MHSLFPFTTFSGAFYILRATHMYSCNLKRIVCFPINFLGCTCYLHLVFLLQSLIIISWKLYWWFSSFLIQMRGNSMFWLGSCPDNGELLVSFICVGCKHFCGFIYRYVIVNNRNCNSLHSFISCRCHRELAPLLLLPDNLFENACKVSLKTQEGNKQISNVKQVIQTSHSTVIYFL